MLRNYMAICPKVFELDHAKSYLTPLGQVTHICVNKLTPIASDNVLLPGWRQAIIWTNAGISLIVPLGPPFGEFFIEILTFSVTKMHVVF